MNTPLYRKLQNASFYGKYIPYSSCAPKNVGTGDTGFSVKRMADVVNNNLIQGKLLADVIKGKDVATSCIAIHKFLYNNFQYKADASDQILRSLSCSWKERETGIDCKSYSIAASILCSNLGVSHAFRRVKQPGWLPNQFTHVYVIVYKNQYSKDIKDGYYVIDGTLPTTREVSYIEADDFPISVGLGFSIIDTAFSLIGGNSNSDGKNNWQEWFENNKASFSEAFNAPGGIFKNLGCLGNSAFNSGNLASTIDQMNAYYPIVITRLNQAVETYMSAPKTQPNNFNPVGEELLRLHKELSFIWTMHYNFAHHNQWQNDCTWNNLIKLIEYGQLMSDRIQKLAFDYVKTYFDEELGPNNTPFDYNSCSNSVPVDYRWCSTQPGGKTYIGNPGLNKYTLKPGITQIPALEFTVPVQNFIANGGNFNIKDILSQATTVIKLFVPSSQGGSNNTVIGINPNENNPFDPNNNQGNNNEPGNTLANTGAMNIVNILIGGAFIAGAVYFANLKSKE